MSLIADPRHVLPNTRLRQLVETATGSRIARKTAPWLLAVLSTVCTFFAAGQVPPLLPPAVALSADPLYATAAGDKPVIALALSVEFPTVGAQYVDVPNTTTDTSYSNLKEYLGYYDAESCYAYNDAPTETAMAPLTSDDYKRFVRTGPALPLSPADPARPTVTSRKCSNAFSGNFLNWSSNSAIDMLRLALTGGDRYIDTPTLTVLQRAVIPNGDPTCMWNSTNFPAKKLAKDGGGTGSYWGAVPTAMITAAGSQDIWVANRLNQIYFRAGGSPNGSCGDQSGYTLGGASTAASHGPIVYSTANQPPGQMTYCAGEGGVCSGFSGVKEVLYGAGNGSNSRWMITRATSGIGCDNATLGDPYGGTQKACYYRDVTSASTPWTPPSNAGALNSNGFFYSRVQVCSTDASGNLLDIRDYAFCTRYPSGNYKPTGAIQKYSDQLRLAAFGYLMDQTSSDSGGRYGGVLRAPMKYVGAKTFDISGIDNTPGGGNPKAEWDASTGVFTVNPENDSNFGRSGVVNYLNQFGRTGPTPGRYKIYDPVGELHSEALRYLQGLGPTPEAVSGISVASTPGLYDGFPAFTTWTDPYGNGRSNTADYSCLKSNIVVIGDINTWDSNRLFTRTPDVTANLPDIRYWLRVVQDFEANITRSYLDGQNVTRSTGNPNGTTNTNTSYGVTGNGPIIGTAYWAHTHDIRGADWTAAPALQRRGLRVKTFTFDVNEYGQQNNVNARRYGNQFFTAAKYGGFETDPSNPNRAPFNTGGNPFKRDDGTVDKYVWEDSDPSPPRVGEANSYYLQSDARGVLSAFENIFSRASTQARSIAGGALNSKNLATGNSSIYQGAFDTSDWSGDLLSIPLTVAGTSVTIESNYNWKAADRLGLLTNPAGTRNIVMGRAGAAANPVATPFSWTLPAGVAGIDTTVRTALDKPSPYAGVDGLGQDRLNYLRGDRSKEGAGFRRRTKLLGDVINSGVVFSGAPTTKITSSSYTGFITANASRTPAVFVGANDGMMHAFNANTGDELFGYIPSWLAPKLSALTSTSYPNNHQTYVDGQLAVEEAQVGTAGTAADWKTVLVGSTGSGGQGVFALDVTNPTAFTAGNAMWEFTDADDPDLGNVVGRPQILKLRTSAPGATATFGYFAVFGSGVNNYAPDGQASSTGNPVLFLLDLRKSVGTPWTLNTNYFKVVLPMNAVTAASNASGLLNFTAALGAAREATQMYLGDLHGNLWKLDFTKAGSSNWNMGKLTFFNKGTAAIPIPYPLYAAKDAGGNVQPITMAPSIAFGPVADSAYVYFGTGKYLESGDKLTTATQSAYAVFDNGDTGADSTPVGPGAIKDRNRLKAGSVNATTGVVTVPAFTWGRATSASDPIRSGWYFDFPRTGEREISNAKIIPRTNTVVFGSLIPSTAATSGACGANAGGGNQYTVDIVSGRGTSVASLVGIFGEPLVAELSSGISSARSDSTGRRDTSVPYQVIQQGSIGIALGTGAGAPLTVPVVTGRLSWRQINNYIDLKNAP